MVGKGRMFELDLEVGIVELEAAIVFLGPKCPYPYAELLWTEMMAMRATTPAGSKKKAVFMISTDRNAQMSVCFLKMKR